MKHTLHTFGFLGSMWSTLGESAGAPGDTSYAHKQAAMFRQFESNCQTVCDKATKKRDEYEQWYVRIYLGSSLCCSDLTCPLSPTFTGSSIVQGPSWKVMLMCYILYFAPIWCPMSCTIKFRILIFRDLQSPDRSSCAPAESFLFLFKLRTTQLLCRWLMFNSFLIILYYHQCCILLPLHWRSGVKSTPGWTEYNPTKVCRHATWFVIVVSWPPI